MNSTVKIKEIFASIQGEGPYIGYKQLFIRFCNCNLKCNYCDTDFKSENDYVEYNACELADKVNKYSDIHSVSLTGGEPLLSTEFLKEFLPKISKKIYLETNATLADKFLEIKPFIDIVSADIKLESSTGIKDTFKFHDKFFEACKGVETFAKIVFNSNITDEEIQKSCELGRKYGIELILQPEMLSEGRRAGGPDVWQIKTDNSYTSVPPYLHTSILSVSSEFCDKILNKFLKNYDRVRLIPQVHKFLNVR